MNNDNQNFTNSSNLLSLGSNSQNSNQKSNVTSLNSNNNEDDELITNLEKLIDDKQNELDFLNEYLKNDDNWFNLRNDSINRQWFNKPFLSNFLPGISNIIYAVRAKKEADRLWSDKVSQRDLVLKQLEDLKSQKFSYMSNIAAQKQKYKIEQDALKKAGISNPYFMLKNGTISGSMPFSFANAGSPNYQSSKGDISKVSDIFKMLLALIVSGAKLGKLG